MGDVLSQQAYDNCESSKATLASDGLSIMVDSEDENDMDALADILMIINTLELPDSLLNEMGATTALMGKQTSTYDDYEVSWSYHPKNGLDAIFKIKQ